MLRNKIDRFLDGELNIDTFQEKESGFTDAYQKVIAEANSQSHEFNPFKKVEITRKYRMRLAKRVLAYAASFLIVISVFWILQKSRLEKTQVVLSDQELLEIKNNVEIALKQFSKELNNCMATLFPYPI